MLSWLASKSKLREKKKTENLDATTPPTHQVEKDPKNASTVFVYPSPITITNDSDRPASEHMGNEKDYHDPAPDEFEGSELIVHTVDGDVMDYLREFRSEGVSNDEEVISDAGDMAQSSLQVRYPKP